MLGVQSSSARSRAAKSGDPVDGHQRRAEVQQLRADVHVQALGLGQAANRLDRVVRRQAELRAVVRRS